MLVLRYLAARPAQIGETPSDLNVRYNSINAYCHERRLIGQRYQVVLGQTPSFIGISSSSFPPLVHSFKVILDGPLLYRFGALRVHRPQIAL